MEPNPVEQILPRQLRENFLTTLVLYVFHRCRGYPHELYLFPLEQMAKMAQGGGLRLAALVGADATVSALRLLLRAGSFNTVSLVAG